MAPDTPSLSPSRLLRFPAVALPGPESRYRTPMRSPHNAAFVDVSTRKRYKRCASFHPPTQRPVIPLPSSSLSPTPRIAEAVVARAARSVSRDPAASSDGTISTCFYLFLETSTEVDSKSSGPSTHFPARFAFRLDFLLEECTDQRFAILGPLLGDLNFT